MKWMLPILLLGLFSGCAPRPYGPYGPYGPYWSRWEAERLYWAHRRMEYRYREERKERKELKRQMQKKDLRNR